MNRREFVLLAVTAAVTSLVRAGAWESDSFDNDDALDWASQCARSDGPAFVSVALNAALADGYLEAPECSMAVAAAEVVAASKGRPSRSLPKELSPWLGQQRASDIAKLAPIAVKSVSRILNGPKSELQELWQENKKEYPAWRRHMKGLIARLN
jgi:hypothetical protein